MVKPVRLTCLDILRGLAIFGMTLVAIQPGGMPLWMYHAQDPPTGYNPSIPGITWVDLIYPFFMFSLGAAVPFALTRRLESGVSTPKIIGHVFWRAFLMAIFALYLGYWYPWGYGASPTDNRWIFWRTLAGFFCLVFFFSRIPGLSDAKDKTKKVLSILLKITGLAGIIALLLTRQQFDSATGTWINGFDGNGMDWVIYRLAQSYILASIVWLMTRNKTNLRWGIIALLVGLRLHHDAGGQLSIHIKEYLSTESWFQVLIGWIPLYQQPPWAYFAQTFKWLIDPAVYHDTALIALMGTVFGDIMFKHQKESSATTSASKISFFQTAGLLTGLPSLTVIGLIFYFIRRPEMGLVLSVFIMAGLWFILTKITDDSLKNLLKQLCGYGFLLLTLGYLFDAVGTGIRKEPSNLSFYFATSGMAFTLLAFLYLLSDYLKWGKTLNWLREAGSNPMLGYIAARHCLFMVMHLTGLAILLETPVMNNTYLYFGYCFFLTLAGLYFTVWLTRWKVIMRI